MPMQLPARQPQATAHLHGADAADAIPDLVADLVQIQQLGVELRGEVPVVQADRLPVQPQLVGRLRSRVSQQQQGVSTLTASTLTASTCLLAARTCMITKWLALLRKARLSRL